MEVNPLSIIFVKSDSKGDRLLFRYPYASDIKDESSLQRCGKHNPYAITIAEDLLQPPMPQTSNICKGQLTGFTDEVLSTLFAVKAELCNRKFELKVNDVRFVGHPTLLPYRSNKDDSSSMILINIVFALRASASHSIVKCYYDLSKRLGKALRYEEKRCSYLSEEMKIMIAAHDEVSALECESTENDEDPDTPVELQLRSKDKVPKSAFHLIINRSSLARSLKSVFEDLSTTGIVQVRINKWVLVSFCLPHKAHQVYNNGLIIEPETIDKCLQRLRPYHGMLLMVNPNELLESMPLDGSAALLRLIKLYSPLKSLQTIAIEADLTLTQVFQLTGHLVYWAKATIIYPLCESNVYVISPGAVVHTGSPLLDEFANEFPPLCLLQVLAEFSLPAPLWYHARCGVGGGGGGSGGGGGRGSRVARIVAWLLRRRLLLQLHTYVHFNHKHWGRDDDGKEYYCEKHYSLDKSRSDSYSSLNQLQFNNIPEPIEARNGFVLKFPNSQEEYPTENLLNQTDFSHTRPIVIKSEYNVNGLKREEFSDSLDDGIDVVEGFVDPKYLKKKPDDNEKDTVLNENSIDSGYNGQNSDENTENGVGENGYDKNKLNNNSPDDYQTKNGHDDYESEKGHVVGVQNGGNSYLSTSTLENFSNTDTSTLNNDDTKQKHDNRSETNLDKSTIYLDTVNSIEYPNNTANKIEDVKIHTDINKDSDIENCTTLMLSHINITQNLSLVENNNNFINPKTDNEQFPKIDHIALNHNNSKLTQEINDKNVQSNEINIKNLIPTGSEAIHNESKVTCDEIKVITDVSAITNCESNSVRNDKAKSDNLQISSDERTIDNGENTLENNESKIVNDETTATFNECNKSISNKSIDESSSDTSKEIDEGRSPRQKSSSSLFSEKSNSSDKKNGLSPTSKTSSDMGLVPPTVVWTGGAGGCDAGDRGPPDCQSEEALLTAFTEEERAALFRIPAAHQPDDLALLAQLHKKGYFRGEQHLEEIMFMENLSRSQVLQLIDKFRDVLITFETEDPAIAMLYSYS